MMLYVTLFFCLPLTTLGCKNLQPAAAKSEHYDNALLANIFTLICCHKYAENDPQPTKAVASAIKKSLSGWLADWNTLLKWDNEINEVALHLLSLWSLWSKICWWWHKGFGANLNAINKNSCHCPRVWGGDRDTTSNDMGPNGDTYTLVLSRT